MKAQISVLALLVCMVSLYPQAGSLVQGPSLLQGRAYHYQFTDEYGKAYMVGGKTTGGANMSNARVYFPSDMTISNMNMPSSHTFGTLTKLSNFHYLVCGGTVGELDEGNYLNNCDVIFTTNSSTTASAPMHKARALCTSASLTSGKVLVVGCANDADAADSAEVYNPTTNSWIMTSGLITGRCAAGVLPLISGSAVVFGGMNPERTGYVDTVEMYNSLTRTFTQVEENLFPGETGWHYYQGLHPFISVSSGLYMGLAFKEVEGITYYTTFTFDPISGIITKGEVELPNSTTDIISDNIIYHATRHTVYLISRLVNMNNTLRIIALNPDVVPDTTTYILPNSYQIQGTNWSILFNGKVLMSGGVANPDGFQCRTVTNYLTLFNPVPVEEEETPIPQDRLICLPNPVTDEAVLWLDSKQAGKAQVVITDIKGRTVGRQERALKAGSNNIALSEITDTTKLRNGVYLASVSCPSNTYTVKVLIRK